VSLVSLVGLMGVVDLMGLVGMTVEAVGIVVLIRLPVTAGEQMPFHALNSTFLARSAESFTTTLPFLLSANAARGDEPAFCARSRIARCWIHLSTRVTEGMLE